MWLVELKFIIMEHGEQFVMISGILAMPESSVDSWVTVVPYKPCKAVMSRMVLDQFFWMTYVVMDRSPPFLTANIGVGEAITVATVKMLV